MPSSDDLPNSPLRFALRYVWIFRGWCLAAFLFETGASTAGISIPYTLGRLTKGIAALRPDANATQVLRGPMLGFAALSLIDMVLSRSAGNCQFLTSPRLRQRVTNDLYAHLQGHSKRFFDASFAGALAHRIVETSAGVTQALWAIIFDFGPSRSPWRWR